MTAFLNLIGESFTNPRQAARVLLSLNPTRDIAFSALGLTVVLSVILSFLMSGGEALRLTPESMPLQPGIVAGMMMCLTTILAFMIYFTGQAMKGTGDLPSSILVMAWMQALFLAGQVVQGFLILMSPGLGTLFGVALTLVIIWVLLVFIDELHQLGSVGRAAFLLFMAFVGVTLGMSFLLTLVGVSSV
ncbi:YIP1 family protein [Shimia ponticola]|uniref:YIP1 family protein n=1 Tax=Shimia ponticola TaxID=2582893 RepID=UPI0011BEE935|nr:YIP1 family protein [Shimia ponticola]